MKPVLYILLPLLMWLACSCGLFRKTHRQVEKLKVADKAHTETRLDSAAKTELKTDVTEEVVTETTTISKPRTYTGKTLLHNEVKAELLRGIIMKLDSGAAMARIGLDSVNNALTLQVVSPGDSTHVKKTEKRHSQEHKSQQEHKSSGLTADTRHDVVKDDKEVKREPKNAFWMVALILAGVLAIATGVWLVIKRVIKNNR